MRAKAEQYFNRSCLTLNNMIIKWKKPFTNLFYKCNATYCKWFKDRQLNVSYTCLDRNLQDNSASKTILIFKADECKTIRLSYQELHDKVCRAAYGPVALSAKRSDRVVI